MRLKVSSEIKGEINLPSIPNRTFKANNIFTVTESQLNSSDIQLALDRKLLTPVDAEIPKKEDVVIVKIKNTSHGIIPLFNMSLKPGEVVFVDKVKLYDNDNIKLLLDTKRITIMEEEEKPEEIQDEKVQEESPKTEKTKTKKVAKKKTKKSKKKKTTKKKTKKSTKTKKEDSESMSEEAEQEEVTEDPNEPKTNMRSWDFRSKTMLEKDESNQKTFDELNDPEKNDDVQVGDVDFSEEKKSESKKSTKKASKKSMKPVGKQREEPTFVDDSPQEKPGDVVERIIKQHIPDEVEFVDQEQEKERIQKNPGLIGQNEEIL